MTVFFSVFLAVHGLIHLAGFAKAFGLAPLDAIRQPISPVLGVGWLAAGVLFLAAALALAAWPRWWWALAGAALVLSILVIVPSWTDARFGALANGLALAGVVVGFLAQGPVSLGAEYDRDARTLVQAPVAGSDRVTADDLAPLPAAVQRYLRVSGVVGQPRVVTARVRMHGRIRSAPDAPWMPFKAEQHSAFGRQPQRLFFMRASRSGLPFQAYHRYVGPAATMHVKAAGLMSVLDAAGAEMTRAETVTLFNDMCVLAPATLIDRAIAWETLTATTVRATFRNAGHTIRAVLVFNEAGELIDFWSDDRGQASLDGGPMRAARWSTPLRGYHAFGRVRLASAGEARWSDAQTTFAYIDLAIDDVLYNISSGAR